MIHGREVHIGFGLGLVVPAGIVCILPMGAGANGSSSGLACAVESELCRNDACDASTRADGSAAISAED